MICALMFALIFYACNTSNFQQLKQQSSIDVTDTIVCKCMWACMCSFELKEVWFTCAVTQISTATQYWSYLSSSQAWLQHRQSQCLTSPCLAAALSNHAGSFAIHTPLPISSSEYSSESSSESPMPAPFNASRFALVHGNFMYTALYQNG